MEDGLELRASYTTFVIDTPAVNACELTVVDWQLVERTVRFLTLFKQATKTCEGDYVTLDNVHCRINALSDHYKEQQEEHKANKSLLESLVTSLYAFDKCHKLIDTAGAYTKAISH